MADALAHAQAKHAGTAHGLRIADAADGSAGHFGRLLGHVGDVLVGQRRRDQVDRQSVVDAHSLGVHLPCVAQADLERRRAVEERPAGHPPGARERLASAAIPSPAIVSVSWGAGRDRSCPASRRGSARRSPIARSTPAARSVCHGSFSDSRLMKTPVGMDHVAESGEEPHLGRAAREVQLVAVLDQLSVVVGQLAGLHHDGPKRPALGEHARRGRLHRRVRDTRPSSVSSSRPHDAPSGSATALPSTDTADRISPGLPRHLDAQPPRVDREMVGRLLHRQRRGNVGGADLGSEVKLVVCTRTRLHVDGKRHNGRLNAPVGPVRKGPHLARQRLRAARLHGDVRRRPKPPKANWTAWLAISPILAAPAVSETVSVTRFVHGRRPRLEDGRLGQRRFRVAASVSARTDPPE